MPPPVPPALELEPESLVMDIADTLRRGDLPPAAVMADGPELRAALRDHYARFGIPLDDKLAAEGIAAFREERFRYIPPRGPIAASARLYVARARWAPAALAVTLALIIGLGGYFFGYRPYKAAEATRAEQELSRDLPAQLDAAYDAIFNETKVQSATDDAAQLRDSGKDAAARGDRPAVAKALASLKDIDRRLRQAYTLVVADASGVKPAFWSFPPNNTEATNYYVVVEAHDRSGKTLSLPITSEDTGQTATVSRWGIRVPQNVYDAVLADKGDDGIIEHAVIGYKQEGFLDIDYAVPVLGGAVTQW